MVPLELAAGLIHRMTPALAYSVALGYSAGPMRHYEAQMKAAHRAPPARATLERMAAAVGGCAAQDIVKVEAQIRPTESLPAKAHAIAVSLNRTSEITARMMADVLHCQLQKKLSVVVVQDGGPELWTVIETALKRAVINQWREVLDRYHVNERLAKVLEIVEADPERRRRKFEKWQYQFDHDDRTVWRIIRWINDRSKRMPQEQQRHAIVQLGLHANYLDTHAYRSMMNYASLRRAGLPIASGAVEGACKSLVACRAKRSGQRWKQDGLTAVLTLRSLALSDRLPSFWCQFAKRFSANIAVA